MSKPILSVSNVSVIFDHQQALRDISFDVNEHDTLVIVGPNGAGKSTLLKTLLGLIAHSGTITWHTKKIGYLPPQEAILKKDIPPLTVKDFFSLQSAASSQYEPMLKEVGLPQSILTQSFNTLSTGQFQRMMLAWILIDNPDVILLDEPTAGIDIGGKETIYTLLHTIWEKRKLTIIMVTHDISFIWKHATNVLCINQSLECYGPPEETITPEILKKMYGTEVSIYEHRHPLSD